MKIIILFCLRIPCVVFENFFFFPKEKRIGSNFIHTKKQADKQMYGPHLVFLVSGVSMKTGRLWCWTDYRQINSWRMETPGFAKCQCWKSLQGPGVWESHKWHFGKRIQYGAHLTPEFTDLAAWLVLIRLVIQTQHEERRVQKKVWMSYMLAVFVFAFVLIVTYAFFFLNLI